MPTEAAMRAVASVALLFSLASTLGAQQQIGDHCRDGSSAVPSNDIYCLELLRAPTAPATIEGHLILDFAPGPFTLAATRDGVLRYRPRTVIRGLPDPATLPTPARSYIAWATTPLIDRWQRLGVVGNGVTPLDVVAWDQFVIVISAEQDSTVTERSGPVMLRGGSPSTRMQPPDFLEFATGMIGLTAEEIDLIEQGHAHHAHDDGWGMVPMPDGFAMPPAEMMLRPTVTPRRVKATDVPALAGGSKLTRLSDGDSLVLAAGIVRKRIHGREHLMYAFNGQIPGPLLWVERGTTVTVRFINRLDQPSTIHWHGLRHDYRMDGVPGLSQEPVQPGDSFSYTLRFPDSGVYWYHPHVREDIQQDLGLSGNIVVRGMEGLPPVDREEIVLLDDILVNDEEIVPYGQESTTHALMGRFGNLFLVNGEPTWQGSARRGETVRFWFTNAANTRTFNLSFTNAQMTLVAADMGAFTAPLPVESVVLAPAERYAVDVTFTGTPSLLVNRVRAIDHFFGRFVQQEDTLGVVNIAAGSPGVRETNQDEPVQVEADAGHEAGTETPDLTLEFGLRTRDLPFITSQMMLLDSAYFHPVEWSGTMPMMNWATSGQQAQWFVRDASTGLENEAATFRVSLGERLVIRMVNLRNSIHAMQHPIHVHGQRFRILSVNGVAPPTWAWKDTVLLPAGATVDLLVEFTNPGHWMLHCHIAEHMEAGMMTHFIVEG
jgi:suppressor of ftsI